MAETQVRIEPTTITYLRICCSAWDAGNDYLRIGEDNPLDYISALEQGKSILEVFGEESLGMTLGSLRKFGLKELQLTTRNEISDSAGDKYHHEKGFSSQGRIFLPRDRQISRDGLTDKLENGRNEQNRELCSIALETYPEETNFFRDDFWKYVPFDRDKYFILDESQYQFD